MLAPLEAGPEAAASFALVKTPGPVASKQERGSNER